MKIYLASPLFTDHERKKVGVYAKILRSVGHQVYVPMEHQIENGWDMDNHEWAKAVFEEDVRAINNSDCVYCLYYGLYSDSGTAWECGYAYGKGIPVHLVDCSNEEVSLMIVNGSNNAEDFFYKNQS